MSDLYRASVVKISLSNGTFGTGFLVSLEKKQIVTCAHVVLTDEELRAGLQRSKKVTVSFYVDGNATSQEATVDPKNVRYIDEGDVAIITVDGNLPADAIALKLLHSEGLNESHDLIFYGYPSNFKERGTDGTGEYVSLTPYEGREELWQIHLTNASSVDKGFSGGPVVLRDTLYVVGMLQFIPGSKNDRQGDESYGLPSQYVRYCFDDSLPDVERNLSRIQIGGIATHLLDRSAHDDELEDRFDGRIIKPTQYVPSEDSLPPQGICLLYGTADDRPEHYIDRLAKHSIEKIFYKGKDVGPPKPINLDWPLEYEESQLARRALRRIKDALNDSQTDTEFESLATKIYRENNGPVVFYTIHRSENLTPRHIVDFFKFWSSWPTRHKTSRETVLAVMVMITPDGFSRDEWLRDHKATAEETARAKKLCSVLFPATNKVSYGHFRSWIDRDDVANQLKRMKRYDYVLSLFPNGAPDKFLGPLIEDILRPNP